MKQTEPPAAMRERFAEWVRSGKAIGFDTYFADHVPGSFSEGVRFGYEAGWQAAQPSSEKIEAVAKRIVGAAEVSMIVTNGGWKTWQSKIAAILREELGGK